MYSAPILVTLRHKCSRDWWVFISCCGGWFFNGLNDAVLSAIKLQLILWAKPFRTTCHLVYAPQLLHLCTCCQGIAYHVVSEFMAVKAQYLHFLFKAQSANVMSEVMHMSAFSMWSTTQLSAASGPAPSTIKGFVAVLKWTPAIHSSEQIIFQWCFTALSITFCNFILITIQLMLLLMAFKFPCIQIKNAQ